MNVEVLRAYCLSKPGATESFPFDEETLVFKVGGKIFALLGLDTGNQINLKCDPERAQKLREDWEEIQPGYHMNKQHWNTVTISPRLSHSFVFEMIDHSYDLIIMSLPKYKRSEIQNLGQ